MNYHIKCPLLADTLVCSRLDRFNSLNTLLYTVSLTFDPVTLTFDLWPWALVVYRLWCDKTLCQIWTQSSNPRRRYRDFNIWPYDLKHVLHIALGSGIIFTKFDLRRFYGCWYVISRCDLDL